LIVLKKVKPRELSTIINLPVKNQSERLKKGEKGNPEATEREVK